MDTIAQLISEFGFPVVLALGMGYFIFFVWKFITTELKPQLSKASTELIRLLDQIRMLDNDLIRLQQKVDTVLEYKETQDIIQDAEEKKALRKTKNDKKTKSTK
jgi:F0F1-type ATP synthase membrane subunit b/b'